VTLNSSKMIQKTWSANWRQGRSCIRRRNY